MNRKNFLLLLFAFAVSLTVFSGAEIKTEYQAHQNTSSEASTETPVFVESPRLQEVNQTNVSERKYATQPQERVIDAVKGTLFNGEISAAIYEADSLRPIYEQKVRHTRSPASLTKLVTASVALMYSNPDTIYTVGRELKLVASDSSVCEIQRGQQLTLYELLNGLLLCSGNDAAYTIAVNVAREVSKTKLTDEEAVIYFCSLMNDFVKSLGAENSNFTTPDGYENTDQYTTAYDMALIARSSINNPIISEITSTAKKEVIITSGEAFTWYNSNFFLHKEYKLYNPNVKGLKTGSTKKAGKCLISVAESDGKDYIVIVMGCETNEQRYGYSNRLLDYIFPQKNRYPIAPFRTKVSVLFYLFNNSIK